MHDTELKTLFHAKSVAVVGVSDNPNKIGSVVLGNLIKAGYKGDVFVVNPKHKKLYGHTSYSSLKEIPKEVELVCIAVPARFVKNVVEESAQKKVKSIIIITSGFAESGEEGRKAEDEMVDICKNAGIRLLGPNCLGVIATEDKLNVSFAASNPIDGDIAFVSQSGAFCTSLLDISLPRNIGFSHIVSMGNKADISELDFIADLHKDKNVKVLAAYLEEVTDGLDFFKAYTTQENPRPFIVFKPGRTKAAKQAISSHTGSIAGSLSTFHTAAKQHGIVVTTSMRDLMNLMMGFSWSELPKGKRIAIVTNAGGPGIIATDEIVSSGLALAKLSEDTKQKLHEVLPSTASIHNPIDIGGDALADRYQNAINIVLKDPGVDIVLVILTPQFVTQIEETARFIVSTVKLSEKIIAPVFIGEKYAANGIRHLFDNKVAAFRDISDATIVLNEMANFAEWKKSLGDKQAIWDTIKKVNNRVSVAASGKKSLNEEKIAEMLSSCDISIPNQKLCSTIEEARAFSDKYGKVVAKVSNALLAHKIDTKGVYTGIKTLEKLEEVWNKLIKFFPTGTVQILLQEQIKAKEELFIGIHRDGDKDVYGKGLGYGHVLIFGKGGIYSEIYEDFQYALVPVTEQVLLQRLADTKVSKILVGARSQNPLAVGKFVALLKKLQRLVITYPEITSMDLNPVIITEEDVYLVDVKIYTD